MFISLSDMTPTAKWTSALVLAILFLILSLPYTYGMMGKLTNMMGVNITNGSCPNMYGIVLQSVVFLCVVRILLWQSDQ